MTAIPLWVWDSPGSGADLASEVVRNNLNAIGRWNYTEDAAYPTVRRDGMPRINAEDPLAIDLQWWHNGAWRTLIPGLQAYPTLARRVEFEVPAASPLTTWTINHGLSARPLVQCLDGSGVQIIPTSITHVQVGGKWDRVVIVHGGPTDGLAILVG